MQVFRSKLPASIAGRRTAVTIGSFDGLHLGHRKILEALLTTAANQDLLPMAVTFDPHPRSFLSGDQRSISMLYSFDERMKLLQSAGIEHVFVIDFNESVRQLSPRGFVEEFVLKAWNSGHVVAGYNHSFGRDRAGDRESLIAMGRELGFGVEIVPPVVVEEQIVSSTVIRRLIMEGELPLANTMLGRKFSLSGRVIRGFARGRRMGCPTANLADFASGKIVPRDGIYAAIAEVEDYAHPAAVSIGFNPTFGGQMHSVEAHLLDFDADLYDRTITLRFVKRLRGEVRFSGEQALAAQMKQDILEIRGILEGEGYSLTPRRLVPHENVI